MRLLLFRRHSRVREITKRSRPVVYKPARMRTPLAPFGRENTQLAIADATSLPVWTSMRLLLSRLRSLMDDGVTLESRRLPIGAHSGESTHNDH